MQFKKFKGVIAYLITFAIFLVLCFVLWENVQPKDQYTYSTIVGHFETGNVKNYELDLGTGQLVLKTKEDKEIKYKVPYVSLFLNDIEEHVKEYNKANPEAKITYDYKEPKDNSWLLNFLPTLILTAVLIGFFVYMMKAQGGGGKISAFGKAGVKELPPEMCKVNFTDVAGATEEKAELEEIVDFLRNPKKFNELGARIPKGVLLMGPPGTGKTLLAKAVAGEARVPFFSISGSDFVEMFVGVGASRVRDLFEKAKKNSPSIIFIDEIDAVGRHRGAGLGGGHDEREQTLNQLLVEMDGFSTNQGVIVIAATNRKDILDPALLRPGRFDRQIFVNAPDLEGREAILKVHTRNKPLGPDVDLKTIARSTAGFTGADLENLTNEAALLAARRGKKAITMAEIEEASMKVIAGPEKKSRKVRENDKKITAFHEAGHAVCTYFCKTQDPVHQISIIPRGMAAGYTVSLPLDERTHVLKTELEERIVVLLGGRAAEKLVLDDITTGASHDIEVATGIAKEMVMRYGFSEELGPILYAEENSQVFLGRDIGHAKSFSDTVAAKIDSEIKRLVEGGYKKAQEILSEHMDKLNLIAEKLLETETLDEKQFSELMEL